MVGSCINASLAHEASCELIKQWVCQVQIIGGDFGKDFCDGKSMGYHGTKWAILERGVSGVEIAKRWVICCYFCA